MFSVASLWIPFTIIAALGQVARNAMQRELTAALGTVGILLAVPIAATVAVLLRHTVRYYERSAFFGREDDALVPVSPAMAVVFQEYGRSLYPWLTVRDNVALPLKARGMPKAERRAVVEQAVAEVGLGHALDTYPWQLSGGMQQRVAIARAVAYQPEILVMDEPFAAVDAQTRADLEDLVRRVWRDLGVTVLFVTHDIDESVYLGERVLMLSSSPTFVQEDLAIDLPDERDQLTTRAMPRFTELRTHMYEQIQRAKRGAATPVPH